MSDYSQITNFTTKDGLASGDPEKIILGSDVDAELAAIAVAIATKFDSADIASNAQAAALTSDTVLITPAKLSYAMANASAILFGAGSAALPSIAFSGDPDTGLYNLAADTIGFSAGGTARFAISTTSVSGTLPYLQIDGSVSAPSYTFTDDTDTGVYRAGANLLRFAAGGSDIVKLSTTFATFNFPIFVQDGSNSAPAYSFEGDTNTGIYRPATDTVGIAAGGALKLTIDGSGVLVNQGQGRFQGGTASAPGVAFDTDLNTGFYRISADAIGIATGGTDALTLNTNAAYFRSGSPTIPSVSFIADSNTGIYSAGSDIAALVAGGVESAYWDNTTSADSTRLSVYSTAASTIRRIVTGAADSGGAGFRMLRIAN